MKSYTDIEQSKKLAEFLPLKSADMRIGNYVGKSGKVDGTNVHYYTKGESFGAPEIINAWSLAALLGVINKDYYMALYHDGVAWNFDATHHDNETDKHNTFADTPVDACYEMIIKLHEQKIL